MVVSMQEVNQSLQVMNASVNHMRYSIGNVSRPMNFMNSFVPW